MSTSPLTEANPANPANPDTPAHMAAETPVDMETAEAPSTGTSGKPSWIEQMEQEEEDLLRVDTNVEETDFGDSAHGDDDALLDLDKEQATVPQVNSNSRVNRLPDNGKRSA